MRRRFVSLVSVIALAGLVGVVAPAGAKPFVAADPAVISKWDAIAFRTAAAGGASAQLYLGIVSAAVYNAVVTIEGRFEPYTEQPRAHANASPEAAAATAAYRVLLGLFPTAAGPLAADYETSLAAIPNGVGKVHGVRVGEEAAAAILALREDDGRNAPIDPLPVGDDPGEWRGTPPSAEDAPMLFPWLGFTTPLMLDSPVQFAPPGPDLVGTAAYAIDFAEVLTKGKKEGSTRSPDETRTAWFFSDNVIRQYQEGRALLAAAEDLDIVEAARLNAIANMSMADAVITCWRAKYDEAFWRPITANPDDGRRHLGLVDSVSALSGLHERTRVPQWRDVGNPRVPVPRRLRPAVEHQHPEREPEHAQTAPTVRHYTSTSTLDTDTMNARVWLGIHFRKAMIDGNGLGHEIVEWSVQQYFQPVG